MEEMRAKRSLSKKFRASSAVEPISHENDEDDNEGSEVVYDQFRVLFRLCAVSGIPLCLSDTSSGEERWGVFALVFFGLLNLVRVANFAFVCRYASYFLRLNSLLIAFYAFHLCSLAVLGMVTLRRRDVRDAALTIVRTVSRVNPSDAAITWNIARLIFAYAVAVVCMTASVFYAVFDASDDELDVPATVVVFGHPFEGERRSRLLTIVRFSMTFAFFSNSATCGSFLLLSATAYHHLSETVRHFGRKLKRRFDLGSFGQAAISENILAFQTIAVAVSGVDAAFSGGVLFLYCVAVGCFFLATSVALSASDVTVSLHVFASVQFAAALLCFFLVTATGGQVPARARELRHALVACSGRVARDYPSVRELTSFAVMAQDIRTADLHVTGGNMFVIRKDMILNVAGVMITYGVLIFQLDKHNSFVENWKNMAAKNGTFG